MKRSKFMLGTLALSMGLLGTGYAAWTDSLTVKTTVSTGTLDVQFVADETDGVAVLVSDESKEDAYVGEKDNVRKASNRVVVKDESTEDGTIVNVEDDKLKIDFTNLHPQAKFVVTAPIQNIGTIPAKVANVQVNTETSTGNLMDGILVEASYQGPGEDTPVTSRTCQLGEMINATTLAIGTAELKPGEEGTLTYTFTLDEANTTQELKGEILDLRINWVQGDTAAEIQ